MTTTYRNIERHNKFLMAKQCCHDHGRAGYVSHGGA